MKKSVIPILLLVILLLSACGRQPADRMIPSATNTISSTPSSEDLSVPTQTLVPSPLPTFPPDPTSLPTPTLQSISTIEESAPWLIFSADGGMYIISQDGTEVTLIPTESQRDRFIIESAPFGGLYATLTYWGGDLAVKSIQQNEILLDVNLLSFEGSLLEFDNDEDAYQFEADRHYSVRNLVWSHNGEYLAFSGSLKNYSPDWYVFNLSTGELSQIASTRPLAAELYWTPDDANIFYADVQTLNADKSGSGYSQWEFFVSQPDGTGTNLVFRGLDYGWEQFVGWYSNEQALMYSDVWWCGGFDLRLVNVMTGKIQNIFSDYFYSLGYDPTSQTALIWVPAQTLTNDECIPERETGLYFVSIPDGQVEKVEELSSDVVSIKWNEALSQFILRLSDDYWAYVDLSGQVTFFSDTDIPIISPNGEWIARMGMFGNYIYITDNVFEEKIDLQASGDFAHPIWSPNGERFFFFYKPNDGEVYRLFFASAPEFEPKLVAENIASYLQSVPQWVLP